MITCPRCQAHTVIHFELADYCLICFHLFNVRHPELLYFPEITITEDGHVQVKFSKSDEVKT